MLAGPIRFSPRQKDIEKPAAAGKIVLLFFVKGAHHFINKAQLFFIHLFKTFQHQLKSRRKRQCFIFYLIGRIGKIILKRLRQIKIETDRHFNESTQSWVLL